MTKIICKIDNRERDVFRIIKQIFNLSYTDFRDKIVIESEMLNLGDIILCDEKNTPIMLIERKSISDLLASIKDGRYSNQSARLLECGIQPHSIVYLIEGNVMLPHINKNDRNNVLSSCYSLNQRKGFSVQRTFNIQETCEYILRCCYKMYKSMDALALKENIIDFSSSATESVDIDSLQEGGNTSHQTYGLGHIQKMKKNSFINKDNIDIIMLCQIPNVSEKTACQIVNHFDGIYEFIDYIKTNQDDFNNKIIFWTDETGKKIKLRKNVSETVYDYFISE